MDRSGSEPGCGIRSDSRIVYSFKIWGLLFSAWTLFLSSLFLPFASSEWVGGGSPTRGWDLGFVTFLVFPKLLSDLTSFPRGGYICLIVVGDVLFIISPLLIACLRKSRCIWYKKATIAASLVVCGTPFVFSPQHYFIGYFAWCLAFLLLTIAVHLPARANDIETHARGV
jgi:hypothetical protein